MTTLLTEPGTENIWSSMPGWGIVADLTPPELVTARSLRVLRKQLAVALLVVVLLCVAGYVWADQQAASANDKLATAQATTTVLTAQNAKYSNVVALQTANSAISTQIATLLANDVDVAGFTQRVATAAPAGTVFSSIVISLGADTGGAAATTGTAANIGTLTMSGTSRRMVDVASYVTTLQALPGLVNVIPATNSATKPGGRATWSITAQLTDKLYTHRFRASSAASNATGGGNR